MRKIFALLVFSVFFWPNHGFALPIQRVISPKGIEAWLVSDPSLPVIALQFHFRTGTLNDPDDQPGTARFLAEMMTEGAGKRDAKEFAAQLDNNSISLDIGTDTDSFGGSLKTLSVHRDLAFSLLHDALIAPRYDTGAMARVRENMLTDLNQSLLNPQWQIAHMLRQSLYGPHPLAGRPLQTLKSLPLIQAAGLEKWRREQLTLNRLLVTVVGDIAADELAGRLDSLFGALQPTATGDDVTTAALPDHGNTTILERDVPQALLQIGLPGIDRQDPDWFAAVILDRIYGGGGFQSRLMQKIRVERGLTYGIYSQLSPGRYADSMLIGTSTRPEAIGDILTIIRDEMTAIKKDGITEKQLKDAQDYISGSFALSMTSTDSLAQVLMAVRRYDLGIDYIDRRKALIDAVTLADIKRVAERLYRPELLRVVVLGKGVDLPDAKKIPAPAKGTGPDWVKAIESAL